MRHIQTFQVFPNIPEKLAFLETLSRNLWWSWNGSALELYRRIDPKQWQKSGKNPIVFATLISQSRLERLAEDKSFLAHLEQVEQQYDERVLTKLDQPDNAFRKEGMVAYFSMEFGIHESLPLFAGGLGILAGDHLKASSGLDLPLIGVGLLYRGGYFRQYLNHDGWQQEDYPETDLYHLPVHRAKTEAGTDLTISISGPGGDIVAQVWRITIGRIPLILLDTDLPGNPAAMRDITARLYSGEHQIRLAQEALLGIGGLRALAALGIRPTICHLNEGHCSFVGVERLRQIMDEYDIDLAAAREIVPRSTVFTTHTPVAAGHDEFAPDLVKPYLKPFETRFNMNDGELVSWGQHAGTDKNAPFSMFVLGLRLAQFCNGVSALHGRVARHMWSDVWPNRTAEEVPITHITNGVHTASVLSPEIRLLFERYLGPQWYMGSTVDENIERIDDIFDEELWRAHEMSRSRLIRNARELLAKQYRRRNAPVDTMKALESVLDQDCLTIAFARRFATYKRANLLFKDPERLESIVNSKDRPVQFIFAGKAHPKDNEGKEIIKTLIHFARNPNLRDRLIFLEDYDLNTARHLVQGADVWLNTPRRPLEACGTSGMKAAANGVLNLSILDGWWVEGYTPERGWRIGNGEEYQDTAYQDSVESQALYNLIENNVAPLYYDRTGGGQPAAWIEKMKASMKMALRDYCSYRMVKEYEQKFYISAQHNFSTFTADGAARAKELSVQHRRLKQNWHQVSVEPPVRSDDGPFRVNQQFEISAVVHLGGLRPEEVTVELFYGQLRSLNAIRNGQTQTMIVKEDRSGGTYLYQCTFTCTDTGRYGFSVHVSPQADNWIKYQPGLLTWA
ncbi:MAG: alpha-glucan family phosphorylase [Desulfobacteraceae bacterium]|nr:alpha-glucan family phosphorylase [Desulfobacteraceae bacterium]